MVAPRLDILPALYNAITGEAAITGKLGVWNSVPSVHTRRPVPSDATYPLIAVGPIVARSDEDGINDYRPLVVVDINIYGEQDKDYRDVEEVAERVYGLFHRNENTISVTNYSVTQIACSGPSPSPVDDESRVGRRITLTVRLQAA